MKLVKNEKTLSLAAAKAGMGLQLGAASTRRLANLETGAMAAFARESAQRAVIANTLEPIIKNGTKNARVAAGKTKLRLMTFWTGYVRRTFPPSCDATSTI